MTAPAPSPNRAPAPAAGARGRRALVGLIAGAALAAGGLALHGAMLRGAVTGALDEVAAGGSVEVAVATLAARGDEATERVLVDELDAVSDELRRVTRDVVLGAARSRGDAEAGPVELERLAAALDRWIALAPGERLDAESAERLGVGGEATAGGAGDALGAGETVAGAQARWLGGGERGDRLAIARVCCEVLGKIGRSPAAIDALGRYVLSEADERRASVAGVALCEIGGRRAERLLARSVARFAPGGPFTRALAPHAVGGGDPALRAALAGGQVARAREALAGRDEDAALEALARAVELDPRCFDGWLARGRLHFEYGRTKEAVADLGRAVGLAPGHREARVTLGRARLAAGDLVGARDALDQVIAREEPSVELFRLRARIRTFQDDLAGAIEDLTAALAIDGRDAGMRLERAMIAAELGLEPRPAREDLRRVIALDPPPVMLALARAFLHAVEGRKKEALAAIEEVLAIDPERVEAYRLRASSLIHERRWAESIAEWGRAIEIEPHRAGSWTGRAIARKRSGDHAGALEDLGHALALSPTGAQIYRERGAVFLEQKDFARARADLARAVELDPGLSHAWTDLGTARMGLGDVPGAVEAHGRAVEIEPDLAIFRFNRSLSRAQAGDLDGAIDDLASALRDDPRSHLADEIRERLRALMAARDAGR